MASLTIRNIPDDVMEKLRKTATEENRSLNAQVLHWLAVSARRELSQSEGEELYRKIEALSQRDNRPASPGLGAFLVRYSSCAREKHTYSQSGQDLWRRSMGPRPASDW